MNCLQVEIEMIKYLDYVRNLIVTNCSYGLDLCYEADIVCLGASYATEIEIKVSRSDLLADKKKKPQAHNSNLFKFFYFAVPEKLEEIALKEIPERAGLYVIRKKFNPSLREAHIFWFEVEKVREAQTNPLAKKWDIDMRCRLARLGAIKVLSMKANIEENNRQKEFVNNRKKEEEKK